ncbi:MAG: hypothetical protein QOJ56_4486 [Mycobacterium sp.]|nr:hypothetical protein [Mycobacterium sp.]
MDFECITHPLRLAGGSHQPGSGKGCAINAISYINGDEQITDFPATSARPLAPFVQLCNDLTDRQPVTDHRQHGLIPLLSHAQLPHSKECQGSAEVTVKHQPKHCQASAETEMSSINRGHTNLLCAPGRIRTCETGCRS